ncbi:uncharacterized protein LOC107268248 [Cephus cinctus]|uniref:Uncharacterized protein LOC107268248 n=1 Tax=Cephus cinctus TaxID=211228 RepID=A0AAJ7FKJ9_CEPCN|nr:uncharacterized protein LOC107268248 [Cephus cinctus]
MLGITSPDEFANTIMKKPGYMTVSGGEIIFLIKYIPVEVKIRRTERCYQQLPVYKGNDSYFITPRTHMLIRTGTEIDCNDIVAPMYYIHNIWYKFTPNPQRAIEPMILKPDTEPTWEYQSIDVGSSGIYSDQEMEKLRKHIMFPAEKPAVLSNVARGVTGQTMEKQGMSISYLLDEETINTIVKDTWKKTWGWFTGFGTFSAGLLGIWMIVKFLKFVVDTILHGIALHTIHGWSLWLIGAIWDSLTSFLLHLGQRRYTDGMTGSTADTKIPDENEKGNLEVGPPSAPQFNSMEQRSSNQTQPQTQTQTNVLYPSLKNESGKQPNEQPKVIYVHMDEN